MKNWRVTKRKTNIANQKYMDGKLHVISLLLLWNVYSGEETSRRTINEQKKNHVQKIWIDSIFVNAWIHIRAPSLATNSTHSYHFRCMHTANGEGKNRNGKRNEKCTWCTGIFGWVYIYIRDGAVCILHVVAPTNQRHTFRWIEWERGGERSTIAQPNSEEYRQHRYRIIEL